eukprot:gb/GEZN01009264.1/.p1 GENE.gb/GEZN01009264.1/~~gb/GEZN01009264.1/.p1  ORF type:complete len:354 (-),score=22.47 gb/GEZN01009264.1/:8-1069(-)
MGNICRKEGREAELRDRRDNDGRQQKPNELKLLLLGTGESGKSTLLKQLIQMHGTGFNEEATRLPYKPIVYTNTLLSMKTLVKQSKRLYLDRKIEHSFGRRSEKAVRIITDINDFSNLTKEQAYAIKSLWADPSIREAYEMRNTFQLPDECKWFFQRVDLLAREDYIPSYDDMLRCRARSTGIVETCFTINEFNFRLLDVGGQRNERRKWIHCFENVTALIFVAAISEYDQVLYEDQVTNRLHEALDLFQEICNSRWFLKTATILFLNKNDLFKEKIKRVDMNCCFEDYDGGLNYDEATAFLKEEFRSRNQYPRQHIYVHITCATSLDNVRFTFHAVKDIVIRAGLARMGLSL